ncbi:MAG: PilZ domain-containing protein [Phycisphaerales bacterium]|nr:PilZ domain-containing protein [Planctomycetota bacterium]
MAQDPRDLNPVIGQIEPKPLDARGGPDRRRHTRMYVRKPCKVLHKPSGQFLVANTHDFSVGGAMIWLEPGRSLNAGDEIDVIVGWNASAIVRQDSSVAATVLRALPMDGGRQAIAVRFKVAQVTRIAA